METAAIAASSSTIGLADSQLYFLSAADINTQLDKMLALGVTNVRIQMPWAGIEPNPNQFDWAQTDLIVNAATQRNMGVLGVLNSTPAWAAAPGTPPYAGAPVSNSDYADFAAAVASRYAGKVSAYEVWNEPNIQTFWAPQPDANAYTALLKAAYGAIKAADPSATVIGGVLTSTLDFGSLATNPVRFIQEMYAAGAQGYFDALSFHPYQYSTKFSDGLNLPESPLNQLNAIRALMAANGDAAKQVWATEYGLPTSVVTQEQQAAYIADILSAWKSAAGGGPIFIYTTRDAATGSVNPEDNFGLYTTDWIAKLAANVVKQAIQATLPPVQPPVVDPVGAAIAAFVRQAAQALATLTQNFANAFISSVANALATAVANFFSALAPPQAAPTARLAAVPDDQGGEDLQLKSVKSGSGNGALGSTGDVDKASQLTGAAGSGTVGGRESESVEAGGGSKGDPMGAGESDEADAQSNQLPADDFDGHSNSGAPVPGTNGDLASAEPANLPKSEADKTPAAIQGAPDSTDLNNSVGTLTNVGTPGSGLVSGTRGGGSEGAAPGTGTASGSVSSAATPKASGAKTAEASAPSPGGATSAANSSSGADSKGPRLRLRVDGGAGVARPRPEFGGGRTRTPEGRPADQQDLGTPNSAASSNQDASTSSRADIAGTSSVPAQ
ncbi:cellulase family glycosylhydrolase [Mycobacterium sp. NPDC006124]|uniref:cellulase family glycosylhydrolase n=1 Tax=Mycobacterium sp. NPDC006124 TaxID=3156729 RepID=UPI0033ACB71B